MTSIGTVAALGPDRESTWQGLIEGRSQGQLSEQAAEGEPDQAACQVSGLLSAVAPRVLVRARRSRARARDELS